MQTLINLFKNQNLQRPLFFSGIIIAVIGIIFLVTMVPVLCYIGIFMVFGGLMLACLYSLSVWGAGVYPRRGRRQR